MAFLRQDSSVKFQDSLDFLGPKKLIKGVGR